MIPFTFLISVLRTSITSNRILGIPRLKYLQEILLNYCIVLVSRLSPKSPKQHLSFLHTPRATPLLCNFFMRCSQFWPLNKSPSSSSRRRWNRKRMMFVIPRPTDHPHLHNPLSVSQSPLSPPPPSLPGQFGMATGTESDKSKRQGQTFIARSILLLPVVWLSLPHLLSPAILVQHHVIYMEKSGSKCQPASHGT